MKNVHDNYKAWNWNYRKIPKSKNFKDVIKFFLEAGILAVNIHNTQPWKFVIKESSVEIYPDWEFYLPGADPYKLGIYISLGTCIANIEIAAAFHNFKTQLNFKKNFVEITFTTGNADKKLASLTPYITKRYSNKMPYLNKKVDKKMIQKLENISFDSLKINLSDNKELIKKMADLQFKSTGQLSKDKKFGVELSHWLTSNNSSRDDGMPGFVVGLKNIQAIIGKNLIRRIPHMLHLLAQIDKKLLLNSPLVGLIASKEESIEDAIAVGRLYQRLALKAASLGISITPMYATLMDKKYRKDLTSLFKIKAIPQFFFRLGYTNNKPYHTPRRSIEKFIGDSETRLADSMAVPYQIKQIEIGKYKINYLVAGQGRPLLLIHGGNIGWGQWYPNIPELSKDFTVYAIDLPGGGRSTKVEFSEIDLEKDMVNVVSEFIKRLNLKKPHLVGSSNGAWIVSKLALKNGSQFGKLILVDAIGLSEYVRPQDNIISNYTFAKFLAKTALKPIRSNKNLEKLIRSVFYKQDINLSKEFIDYFYETMATSHNLLFISVLTKKIIKKELSLVSKLPRINNRTLIIWGEEDKLMPLNKNIDVFRTIPNVKIETIKNAGHIPSIEKYSDFNQLVKKFILG